MTIFDLA